jgi:hypothetical protein
MAFPTEQLVIGLCALIGAGITGGFSVINTKLNRKVNTVEEKVESNHRLTIDNTLLEQIVPALERKDEALDKIAEILDNILRAQTLTSQQLRSITLILENRCQALEVIRAIEALIEHQSGVDKAEDKARHVLEEVRTKLSNGDSEEGGGRID